ncbi:MoxR family ATPase [Deltaproteobacteria bacterium TL4]
MEATSKQESNIPDIAKTHEALLGFNKQFKAEIGKVIVGQESIVEMLVIALFCKGHVLLTGVPGLAKTLLVKTLSSLFHLDFNRIQCTPDLMPSDITGGEILSESIETGQRHFCFIQGPVFTNLLLADEINRTSPRTQAALLQAMQERQITASGKTYDLPNPFIVFATQNPIDSEGTYPLPEAQLDRFLFNVEMTYPSEKEEARIAELPAAEYQELLTPVFEPRVLLDCQKLVRAVPITHDLLSWVVRFVRATRPQESKVDFIQNYVEWGAGVRASQNIVMAARAKALLSGDSAVKLEHVRAVIVPVLRHRIILNFVGEAEKWNSELVIEKLLELYQTPF